MTTTQLTITPTTSYDLFLSIDGGGTKTKVTIAGRKRSQDQNLESEILASGTSESSNHTSVGVRSAILSIGRATVEALKSLPDNRLEWEEAKGWSFESETGMAVSQAPFKKIWAGLSGIDTPSDIQLMTTHLKDLFGLSTLESGLGSTSKLRVTNDGDLLSAAIQIHYQSNRLSVTKPCRGGVVLIAGTGSIAVAFGPQSTGPPDILLPVGRLGGYGFLLGDEGSAFYVGQQTIKEILKFNDVQARLKQIQNFHPTDSHQRLLDQNQWMAIKQSPLVQLVLDHFNINSLNVLLSKIYSIKVEQERKLKIAELSRLVMRCGFCSKSNPSIGEQADPDEFSTIILKRSAERLSELVCDLCHLYDLNPEEMVLCLGGGMWTYPQFQQLVLNTMRDSWGASWGWVKAINEPDQVAALSLSWSVQNM